jgi:hypothetical protein
METDEGTSKENQPREDFSESSKPFQQPAQDGRLGTHRARGRDSEGRAVTRATGDGTAISGWGERIVKGRSGDAYLRASG